MSQRILRLVWGLGCSNACVLKVAMCWILARAGDKAPGSSLRILIKVCFLLAGGSEQSGDRDALLVVRLDGHRLKGL